MSKNMWAADYNYGPTLVYLRGYTETDKTFTCASPVEIMGYGYIGKRADKGKWFLTENPREALEWLRGRIRQSIAAKQREIDGLEAKFAELGELDAMALEKQAQQPAATD